MQIFLVICCSIDTPIHKHSQIHFQTSSQNYDDYFNILQNFDERTEIGDERKNSKMREKHGGRGKAGENGEYYVLTNGKRKDKNWGRGEGGENGERAV